MDLTKILKRESNNVDYIYLYADLEKDWFIAYEFSAYVLTQLFDILELEEEFEPETGTNIYFTRLPDQFILEHTHGHDASIGEEYIRVKLTDINPYSEWRVDFDEQKRNPLRKEIS